MEIYPVLDELASSISTLNLERVRRFKGHLLALTQRVQKVDQRRILILDYYSYLYSFSSPETSNLYLFLRFVMK